MSLILFRILFFCLVPIGIFILVKTIRMLKGIFSGEVIAEIPFTQKEIVFDITSLIPAKPVDYSQYFIQVREKAVRFIT